MAPRTTSSNADPAPQRPEPQAGASARAESPKTERQRQGQPMPRLPHEHDESHDSQNAPQPPNNATGEQAYTDVKRGLVDTDEGRRAHEVQPPRPPRSTPRT